MVVRNLPAVAWCWDGVPAVVGDTIKPSFASASGMVNKDQVKGRLHQVAGKAKRVAGAISRHGVLEKKGRLEEVAGKARATYGDTKEEWKSSKRRG